MPITPERFTADGYKIQFLIVDFQALCLWASTDIADTAAQTELTMTYGSQLTYACLCSQYKALKAKKKSMQ
jgi:hypothetical protein